MGPTGYNKQEYFTFFFFLISSTTKKYHTLHGASKMLHMLHNVREFTILYSRNITQCHTWKAEMLENVIHLKS